jgi:hypothetical protein
MPPVIRRGVRARCRNVQTFDSADVAVQCRRDRRDSPLPLPAYPQHGYHATPQLSPHTARANDRRRNTEIAPRNARESHAKPNIEEPGPTARALLRGSPERIRTAASALRGRRPGPLDDGAGWPAREIRQLGGEDSNLQQQGQNLPCCRLHHPRMGDSRVRRTGCGSRASIATHRLSPRRDAPSPRATAATTTRARAARASRRAAGPRCGPRCRRRARALPSSPSLRDLR